MWGGRIASGPAEIMQRINASIGVDRRLWRQDIAGSRAHAAMLVRQGILGQADGEAIRLGLDQIEKEIAEGRFNFKVELEDIHTNIESRLRELIGAPAGRTPRRPDIEQDQLAAEIRQVQLLARGVLERVARRWQRRIDPVKVGDGPGEGGIAGQARRKPGTSEREGGRDRPEKAEAKSKTKD